MVRDRLLLILGYFLPFYLPNSPKNQNFEKIKKTPADIIILHMCTKNYDQMMVPELWCATDGQVDGQMDGRTDEKSDI